MTFSVGQSAPRQHLADKAPNPNPNPSPNPNPCGVRQPGHRAERTASKPSCSTPPEGCTREVIVGLGLGLGLG